MPPAAHLVYIKNPPETIETPLEVENHIRMVFGAAGEAPDTAIAIAKCESSLIPQQSKCLKTDGSRENSWGIWQINLDANPKISISQAMDPVWSTAWALKKFKDGSAKKEWVNCFNKIQKKDVS